MAGHDINYLSLTGVMDAIGTPEQPVPPLNVVADNGGGSMFAPTGLLAALWRRDRTGLGSVVDVAIVDGVSVLAQQVLELRADGMWENPRGGNLLDGGAPYYRAYWCLDGGFMAVGSIEPQFYQLLVEGLGLDAGTPPDRDDQKRWSALTGLFADRFAEQDREHWTKVFAGTDAWVTPVLTFDEPAVNEHIRVRRSLVHAAGGLTAGTAPRFMVGP